MRGAARFKEALVVGRPNSGKTLFALNFAEWLGVRHLELRVETGAGTTTRALSVNAARALLSGPTPHQTRALQSVTVAIPTGKGRRQVTIIDSTGLDDRVHDAAEIRRAMAWTIRALRRADVVLHMIDAAAVGQALRGRAGGAGYASEAGEPPPVGAAGSGGAALPDIDHQLARVGRLRAGYAVLANKLDLPEAGTGLDAIRRAFPGVVVIPISALGARGFKEVLRFVRRQL